MGESENADVKSRAASLDQFDALRARVTHIENYFKIALGVAAIVGISGGFLWSTLSSVKTQIDTESESVTELQERAADFQRTISELEVSVSRTQNDAVEAIKGTGEEQRAALLALLESMSAEDLADGILKGNVRDVLIRNCGNNSCPCPGGWVRAPKSGGNGDLNQDADGDYIYLCVKRYGDGSP